MDSRPFPCPEINTLLLILLALFLPTLFSCNKQPDIADSIYTARTDKNFSDVVEDVEFAITERNYRIVNTLKIGKAIQERGYSEFPQNTVILFCNLSFARSMLEIEPDYLNHCPARISVRETRDNVLIGGHLFPESGYNQALDEIIRNTNSDIVEIVNYASREWFELNEEPAGN